MSTTRIFLLIFAACGLSSCLWAQNVNLLPNPGFEGEGDWETVTRRGGEGSGAIVSGPSCTGSRSMKLTKTNAVGSVILRSQPVTLQANVKYVCRFRFHTEDASLANLLLLRISTAKDAVLGYNSIDRSAGWMSQSLLINSPADKWEKRVVHYQTDQPREVYVNVVLYGNPCTVLLDDFELIPVDSKISPIKTEFQNATTVEELPAILEARPEATGQVVVRDGRSGLLINGQPTPPVLYKAEPYHVEGDYKRFSEAGLDLATVSVRLGNIKGDPGVWLGKDKYDFSVAENKLQKALLRNPQALIVLDIWFYPYPEWGEENPTECWTNDKGQRGYGTWGNLVGFTDDLSKLPPGSMAPWWYPSYNSRKWREDASAAGAALIEHLRQTPYGKTIAGYFISGGHDGQFQVFGSFDYSEGTRESFAAWLREKYGTIEKLRAVWGEAAPASLEAAVVPPPLPLLTGAEGAPAYLSPGPALDYRDFASAKAWGLRDVFSATVKAAAGKPVFTIAYGNPPQYDFSPLLSLKSLDASAAMSYYPYRNAGYALGFKPPAGLPLHNKLFFQEIDTRSWAGTIYADEVYQMWIGAGQTPAEWQAINRKLAGISLAGQTGFWYYDMNHFFDAPEIMAEIGKTYAEAERLRSKPAFPFRPEVCVVQAGGQGKFLSSDASALNYSHFYQLMALEQSGVPYDLHYLTDVLSTPRLQQYKVYVFYQTRYLTQAQRQLIRQKLQCDGKTLIFMHDDGYLSEQGKSVAAQSEIVGMQVRTEERFARQTPLLVDAAHRPFIGLTEVLLQIMVEEGQTSNSARTQPFWIEDRAATPLAKYAEDGRVAAAVKKHQGWTAAYIAAPNSLSGELLNSLAQQAGAYVCGPAGQSVAMSGDFLSLHGLRSGDYVLKLPSGVKRVTYADTGNELRVTRGTCRVPVVAQKTYWLRFER